MENCGASARAIDGLLIPNAATVKAKDLVKVRLFIGIFLDRIYKIVQDEHVNLETSCKSCL